MPKVEEDYSDYIKHMSNISGLASVLAGFILTTLTLLITLVPDPSQTTVQLTLFFSGILFNIFMFLAGWSSFNLIYFCRKVPRLTRELNIINHVAVVGFSIFGGIIVMIFLFSNLRLLALASTFPWLFFVIFTYIFIWRPFRKFRETRARILTKT